MMLSIELPVLHLLHVYVNQSETTVSWAYSIINTRRTSPEGQENPTWERRFGR